MSDIGIGGQQSSNLDVPEDINHLRGENVSVLVNPKGSTRYLYMECEEGDYRIRVGEIVPVDMPEDAVPESDVSDGTGSLSLREGAIRAIPAPDMVTVRGLSKKSVLTYYWV